MTSSCSYLQTLQTWSTSCFKSSMRLSSAVKSESQQSRVDLLSSFNSSRQEIWIELELFFSMVLTMLESLLLSKWHCQSWLKSCTAYTTRTSILYKCSKPRKFTSSLLWTLMALRISKKTWKLRAKFLWKEKTDVFRALVLIQWMKESTLIETTTSPGIFLSQIWTSVGRATEARPPSQNPKRAP